MRRAQFAMEYLLVVGFSLFLIVPAVALLHQSYAEQKVDIHLEQLTEVARQLAYESERIYYQGAPSRTSIEVYFPAGLEYARVRNNVFEFKLETDIRESYAACKVPLEDFEFRNSQGTHTITLQAENNVLNNPSDDIVEVSER